MRISKLHFKLRQCNFKRKCPFYEKHLPSYNVKWATGGWYQFVCQQSTLVFGVVATSDLSNCSQCDLSNEILLVILLIREDDFWISYKISKLSHSRCNTHFLNNAFAMDAEPLWWANGFIWRALRKHFRDVYIA